MAEIQTIRRNLALKEYKAKETPNSKQITFSTRFVNKNGELIFIPSTIAASLRLNIKENRLRVLSVDANNDVGIDLDVNPTNIQPNLYVNGYIGNIIVEANVYFTLSVQFKDGRYKCDIQSSEIKTLRGSSYTYSELKEMSTEEGLRAYFKKMGMRWTLSKNQLQNSLEGNRLSLIECDKCLQGIVEEFTAFLKKEEKVSNW